MTVARVGAAGPVSRGVVSRQRGAMLDDVAAGPDRAIAVTWAAVLSKTNPLLTATYAGLRREGGAFAVERLSPAAAIVARGSRVAFQPLTGQAVVAIPYVVGRTLAVGVGDQPAGDSIAALPADLLFRPVDELAALVRSGALSADELVEASLQRIDALNPSINAFVDVDHDGARATAAAIAAGRRAAVRRRADRDQEQPRRSAACA